MMSSRSTPAAHPFRYRAAMENGEIVSGMLLAPSRDHAFRELRQKQLFVIGLDEQRDAGRERRPWLRASSGASLAVWTRTIATMLGAGVQLSEALTFATDGVVDTGLGNAVRAVRDAVSEGESFAGALQAHPLYFNGLFVAMVAAGEQGGVLSEGLARLAAHLEESAELRSQLQASLVYPVLLAGSSGLGITILLLFVLPRFQGMIADIGGTLPLSTRLLLNASHLLLGWWWLWLALGIAGSLWLSRVHRTAAWQERRLAWPLFGTLERAWIAARLTRTLGILLRSGVPVLAALRLARASVTNLAIARKLERAELDIADGARVSAALADTLPPLATRLLAAGEESGRLAELCESVADTYDGEVRRTIRGLVALIEPALVITFGVLVGWVALAMLQAIYSVNARAY